VYIRQYKQFVEMPDSEEINQFYGKRNLSSVLGSDRFVNKVKEKFFKKKVHKEVQESKRLSPDTKSIKEAICSYYKIEEKDLIVARRGTENEPRNLAIYLMRTLKGEPLVRIGAEFNLNNYSSVSSVIGHTRKRLQSDRSFRKRLEVIKEMLYKGQTKN